MILSDLNPPSPEPITKKDRKRWRRFRKALAQLLRDHHLMTGKGDAQAPAYTRKAQVLQVIVVYRDMLQRVRKTALRVDLSYHGLSVGFEIEEETRRAFERSIDGWQYLTRMVETIRKLQSIQSEAPRVHKFPKQQADGATCPS